MMPLNCQSLYLVTVDHEYSIVNVYKDEFIKFKEPFLVTKAGNSFLCF